MRELAFFKAGVIFAEIYGRTLSPRISKCLAFPVFFLSDPCLRFFFCLIHAIPAREKGERKRSPGQDSPHAGTVPYLDRSTSGYDLSMEIRLQTLLRRGSQLF